MSVFSSDGATYQGRRKPDVANVHCLTDRIQMVKQISSHENVYKQVTSFKIVHFVS